MRHLITLAVFVVPIIGLNFTPRDDGTGVIFSELAETFISYDEWHLCFYYDLQNYFEEFDKLHICVDQLKKLCNEYKDKSSCSLIMEQFDNHLENIREDYKTIRSFGHGNSREKRALFEFVGKIDNYLFGRR